MTKAVLSEAAFGRAVVSRVRRERPDLRVRTTRNFELMVEGDAGRRWTVSLEPIYKSYCDTPTERDSVIDEFLSAWVYQEPLSVGPFDATAERLLPQVVPQSLLHFCRRTGQELAAVESSGDLAIAFVLDESERYSYITRAVADRWGKDAGVLLNIALGNLRDVHQREGGVFQRFGKGERVCLVSETFDGYDASRILLGRELAEAVAQVAGTPVLAVPHRDYFVIFGDADPDFVAEMEDKIRRMHLAHEYPISSALYTLERGVLELYDEERRVPRIVN